MAATPLAAHDPLRAGRWRLEGRLGHGGQGTVYLGRDDEGAPAAIKVLHLDVRQDDKVRDRFLREIDAARLVASFCTAQILDVDIDGPLPYVASQFIEGRTLLEAVESGRVLHGDALLRLAISTATALTAIHRAGVVHCDFKPSNVICGPDGARVIDFGIARAIGDHPHTTIMGAPAYMSPERFANDNVGPAADMFAWAATVAFAASGKAPFGDGSLMAIMHRVVHEPPELSGLTPELEALLRECLSKDPADRPAAREVMLRLVGTPDPGEDNPPPAFLDPGGIGLALALGAAGAVVGGQVGGGVLPAVTLGAAALAASYAVRTLVAG